MSHCDDNKSGSDYVYEELQELTRITKQEMITISRLLHNRNLHYALEKMETLYQILFDAKLLNSDYIDKQVPSFFAVKYLLYMRIQLSKKIKALREDLGLESVGECHDNDFNNSIGTSNSFDVVFFCDSAKMYSVLSTGIVEEFSQPEMLCIVSEQAEIDHCESELHLLFKNARFHLPCDDVIYFDLPLKAFMFKVLNTSPNVAVCFSVNSCDLNVLCMTLEDYEYNICESQIALHTEEVKKDAKTVSQVLVEFADYMSNVLVDAACGMNSLVSKTTSKLIENITPESEANIPAEVVTATDVAKKTCNTLANVTGYFATQTSTAVSYLGNLMAPHVKQQSVLLLKHCGMNEQSADEHVSGALEVAGGAVEGFRTVVEGLHKSGAILCSSLTSNTVQIIKHKYGDPVSQVTANTFDSLGSLVAASSNMKSLIPKRVMMKAIKETGKAAALHDYQKNPSTSFFP